MEGKVMKTTAIDWIGVILMGIFFGAMFAWGL